ncbi:MAG: hypothetical protein JNK94_04260 [Hyphomonadaceae bacterium]|nr:hypothetical protein [Hyphomonadaceae bacterium]MBX3510062.1 hypothetical protein [Hyphomonadaceae bacterium]
MKHIAFAALSWFAAAASAAALQPADLVGAWETQWANAAGEAPSGGGPLIIRLDGSEGALDGLTPAPGWDGVQTGETAPGPNGALIWSGRWASIWPEGATMGAFRLVFTDADTFTGTWSTDDGSVTDATWNGARAR